MASKLIHGLGILVIWGVWLGLAATRMSSGACLAIALAGALALIPIVFAARWALDRLPTVERAERITSFLHYLVAVFLGSAILEAVRFGMETQARLSPLLAWLGAAVMAVGVILWAISILNLAVKGLGAPFAISLTRAVATQWLYAWTRNPLVISALALLVGLGLWLQSWLFLAWIMLVLSPAILIYLRVFEERELEIRFGPSYLEYKARTPMLIPRKPG
jgi:protein-S-isoprenylcysteine O-methyltransferase Ste14